MDLFVIACTTCRQRLKVRDLALVGQIQACPNCGSMVHIQPPSDWKPPTDTPATKPSTDSASPSETTPRSETTPQNETTRATGTKSAKPANAASTGKGAAPANGAAANRPASPARQGSAFVPPTATPAGLPTGQPDDPSVRETVFDKNLFNNDFGDVEQLLEPGKDPSRPGKPPGGTSNQITASAIDGIESPNKGKRTVVINRDLAGSQNGGASKTAGKAKVPAAVPAANDDGELAIPPSTVSGSGSFAGGLPGPDSDSLSGLSGSFSLGLPGAQDKEVRRPLLLTGIAVATALGIAVTVLAAVFAKPWLRRPSSQVTESSSTSGTPVVGDVNKETTSTDKKGPHEPPEKGTESPSQDVEPSTPETGVSQENTSLEDPSIGSEPPTEGEAPSAATDETTGAGPEAKGQDTLGMLDDPNDGNPTDEEKTESSTNSAMEASKLNRLISDSSFDDAPKMDPGKIEIEPESTAEGSSRPRPPMKVIDLKARLADKIEGIDIPSVRIDAFVNMMSDLSTIPISLDPEGLLAAGITPQTPVQGKYLKVTVEKALRETLEKQHLDLVTQDGTLVVVASRKQRPQSYKVSDLASNEEELNDLVALIEKIMVVAPQVTSETEPPEDEAAPADERAESVEASVPAAIRAEKGELAADLEELGHFQVRRILDPIRAAGSTTVRESLPEASCKSQGYEASCEASLGTPLKLNFSHGELVREILSKFAEEAKCQILIDWAAVAEAGWPKEADATLVVANKPLSAALDDLLKPMELTCVPVGPGWLQVTTQQALSRQAVIDFYSIADLAKSSEEGAQWIASLSGEVAGEHRQFAFDPASGLLIAKLSMPDHMAIRKAIESRRREIGAAGR